MSHKSACVVTLCALSCALAKAATSQGYAHPGRLQGCILMRGALPSILDALDKAPWGLCNSVNAL